MGPFKPGFHTITEDSQRAYRNDYSNKLRESIWVSYPTYAELKKYLRRDLKQNINRELTVIRYRRGEWGEWFENWFLDGNDTPHISKQGWM